jgi:hypothetical protein
MFAVIITGIRQWSFVGIKGTAFSWRCKLVCERVGDGGHPIVINLEDFLVVGDTTFCHVH